MKGKLWGFAVAVLAAATIGVVQLQTNAGTPGQVGDAPRCTVKAVGARGSAFSVSGGSASVKFTATGAANCKVRLSANSFYAPSANGQPYNQQVLFDRNTKVFGRGTHALTVKVPTKSTPKQGCYYQLDLTYGTYNVTPVLAYAHGKIAGCGEKPPEPAAECKGLTVATLNEAKTQFRFTATASATNGAKINSYAYTVTRNGTQVFTKTNPSTSTTDTLEYSQTTPGTYNVSVVVNTSEGQKNGAQCKATFTVPEKPEEPKPEAKCEGLTVATLNEAKTQFRFTATASVKNGAKISSYVYTVTKGGMEVFKKTNQSTNTTDTLEYSQATPGTYNVSVVVNTSEGQKNGAQCKATFTVPKKPTEKNPAVDVEKLVNNKERDTVAVGKDFTYQLKVTNTGNVTLKNVKVTDTPVDANIKLVAAQTGTITGNTWTYTIPELKVGESETFSLTAKLLAYKAGDMVNNVCVDAPEIPGDKDDCDEVPVDTPKPEKAIVCNPDTKKTMTVDKADEGNYPPADSDVCKDVPEKPETPKTPVELPETGVTDALMQLAGVMSLTGATAYYVSSRRLG